jgi:glyoxylase-like metal-dependent hydrolase (beta-lactamase superfamily II)
MPINYSEYHPKWSLISRLIRYRRAGNKCEQCHVPNHAFVNRNPDGSWRFAMSLAAKSEYEQYGWKVRELARHLECTYIILTVAHLDHNKRNNRFSNLKCLCQRCHFAHDRKDNVIRKRYGRNYDAAQLKINL